MQYQDNPKGRQMYILDELKADSTLSYLDCFSKFSVVFSKTERTFNEDWKKANLNIKEYQKSIYDAKLKASISEEVKAVKNGLKTKNYRLMILQEIVDECFEQISTKMCNDSIVLDNQVKNIKRLMNQRELNDTRKTLNELQKEISKIEGDYAPIKQEFTGKNRNPLIPNKFKVTIKKKVD